MEPTAQLHAHFRFVADAEVVGDGVEEVQRHGRHLGHVLRAVAPGQPTGHHIGVPDRLHLAARGSTTGPSARSAACVVRSAACVFVVRHA